MFNPLKWWRERREAKAMEAIMASPEFKRMAAMQRTLEAQRDFETGRAAMHRWDQMREEQLKNPRPAMTFRIFKR